MNFAYDTMLKVSPGAGLFCFVFSTTCFAMAFAPKIRMMNGDSNFLHPLFFIFSPASVDRLTRLISIPNLLPFSS